MIKTNESQIGLSLFSTQRYNNDELRFLCSPTFNNSFRSPPSSTNEVIIIDDDDEEDVTLEPTKKKPRLEYRYDPFDELSVIFNVLPEAKKDKDVALIADSCFSSSTDRDENTTREKMDVEKTLSTVTSSECDEEKTKKKRKDDDENVAEGTTPSKKGYEHVSLDDLGVSVEDLKNIPWEAFDSKLELMSDPWYRGYIEDNGLTSLFTSDT